MRPQMPVQGKGFQQAVPEIVTVAPAAFRTSRRLCAGDQAPGESVGYGRIPLDIKSRISESLKGLDSVAAPKVTPLAGTQEPPSSTLADLRVSKSNLPSESLETRGKSAMGTNSGAESAV